MSPKVREWLPNWLPMAGIVLFGLIFTRKNPSAQLVAHEFIHWRQQKSMGMFRFYWNYVFFPKRRVALEAEAFAVDVRYGTSAIWCAVQLSGWLYLKPCTYEYALEAIRSRV
jgi:hypothetical protein